mmetsp:Transcript_103/g.198  ORF Transcript_103/g.198 Transcript_103/m.198 type:complete len:598 (-) Transcript_103:112-1905(-)|eukprot:CAMPEP_0197663816 /NCGR_PEP_ID=MMETSP1338-20131121/58256_1 /TAXON_ID=43686 ORGANISM="Pelagodinium beii, Strain RCC1491" /NCGR_SAMPLE_ID=MMETSP1338 /ASSEMBLY_ACC=CAM_ASM_000754 /LENGTH=597 /DNA_ID=CAMNT_0043242321 /DNA_START=120 /DNA_END=1913 /DNA_ORIENTATION=+
MTPVFLCLAFILSANALVEKELRADGRILDATTGKDDTRITPIDKAVADKIATADPKVQVSTEVAAASSSGSAPGLPPPLAPATGAYIKVEATAGQVAIPLFGTLVIFALLLCMLKSQDQLLQLGTWKLIHHSFSLFSTVMLFMIMRKMWRLMVGDVSQTDKIVGEVLACVRFVFLMFSVPFALKMSFADPVKRKFVRTLGAHMIGFSGADCLSDLLKYELFSSRIAAYFGGVCMMGGVLLVLNIGVAMLNSMLAGGGKKPSDEEQAEAAGEPAAEESTPAEPTPAEPTPVSSKTTLLEELDAILVESTGFIMGFLFSIWFRFIIYGNLPGLHTGGRKLSESDVGELWGISVGFIVPGILLAMYLRPMASGKSRLMSILIGCTVEFCAMLASWLFLYADQWEWWLAIAEGGVLSNRLEKLKAANCLAISATSAVLVAFIIARLAKKSKVLLDLLLLNCIGLYVGFGWEIAIVTAIADATSLSNRTAQYWEDITIILCFMLVMLPGWWWYILPEAAKDGAELIAVSGGPGKDEEITEKGEAPAQGKVEVPEGKDKVETPAAEKKAEKPDAKPAAKAEAEAAPAAAEPPAEAKKEEEAF